MSEFDWRLARKKPVTVSVAGPFDEMDIIETIEGDFEIDKEYLEEHGAYYIITGVNDERYPIAKDIFEETYEFVGDDDE